MRQIFRPLQPHNSDLLHEELVAAFGLEKFGSVNTGPYHGEPEFMFVVGDDFTEADEKILDETIKKHDNTKLTDQQIRARKVAVSSMWLKEGFSVVAVKEDVAAGRTAEALDKLCQFAEAVSDVLNRI